MWRKGHSSKITIRRWWWKYCNRRKTGCSLLSCVSFEITLSWSRSHHKRGSWQESSCTSWYGMNSQVNVLSYICLTPNLELCKKQSLKFKCQRHLCVTVSRDLPSYTDFPEPLFVSRIKSRSQTQKFTPREWGTENVPFSVFLMAKTILSLVYVW